ncbi:MAG: fibrillarin-like rRNA/tRNA 2'-O-methyltransferase [Candidatus Aenigmarchaeota archaeon]|nr:fibrillarin-like rRNA/tRNA 2'-O-methyltransferase [Candidatus Aenigmarchaeota archaeon]
MNEIFPGVFRDGKKLYTVNAAPGRKVYGEKLVKKEVEYREWAPERSKLGAAIANRMKVMPIGIQSSVLYLGASTGTTVSHVSDIARNGIVYALEFAERVFRPLLDLQKVRKNIAPLLADARKPETYGWVELCDVVFADVAQPDETEIAIRNAKTFLKKGGYIMVSIKSQSIDVTKNPKDVYREEAAKLEKAGFSVVETVNLEPYEDKHALIVAKYL